MLDTHRKICPVGCHIFAEPQLFQAGSSMHAFDTPFGRTGILICNDAWQPGAGERDELGEAPARRRLGLADEFHRWCSGLSRAPDPACGAVSQDVLLSVRRCPHSGNWTP